MKTSADPNACTPPLLYVVAPEHFKLPPGMNFGSTSGIAFNSKGHIFVFHRGPNPLIEFDPDGNFLRAWGDGFFDRPHGLRIDADDNIWLTDLTAHFALKLSPDWRILMVLGVKGTPGEWHQYGHLRLLHEPNEIAVGPDGDIFLLQGHGQAESCVLKFDRDGNFIKSWGRTGAASGEFDVPHSIVIDADGLLHIADRVNQRIQVFDAEGRFIRQSRHPGTPCGLFLTPDQRLFMAHGHAGQVMQLDLHGNVLGIMASQGKGFGQFGEAHYIAVSPRDEIFVADTLNWRVVKLVRARA